MSNTEQMPTIKEGRITATFRRSTLEENRRRNSNSIRIEGLFEYDVLGIFKVIRGFADLRDLAEISEADYLDKGGVQRREDDARKVEIKNYLENQANRFFPEVILSLRATSRVIPRTETITVDGIEISDETPLGIEVRTNDGIVLAPTARLRRDSNGIGNPLLIHRLTIDRSQIKEVKKRIRRIDGNHRLSSAAELSDTDFSSRKYWAPFCLLLLNDLDQKSDDYSEALIFHAINSKAVPVHSEHALRLVLDQREDVRMTVQEEFDFDPALYLTRLLQNWLEAQGAQMRTWVGSTPRSAFNRTAQCLVHEPGLKGTLDTPVKLKEFADEFCIVLNQVAILLQQSQKRLCQTPYFWEVVARVWLSHSKLEGQARIEETVRDLEAFGGWTEKLRLLELEEGFTLGEGLLHLFYEAQYAKPQRVFLARWYPGEADTERERRDAEDRFAALRTVIEDEFKMQLIDMGTQKGGSFPIHAEMYRAIEGADIFVADLTGKRANVMIELGFGLRHIEQGRFIMIFQPKNKRDQPPFDIKTFRHEIVAGLEQIKAKLREHLTKIMASSAYEGDPTHSAWRSWLSSDGVSVLKPKDHQLLVQALESVSEPNEEQAALLTRLKTCSEVPWAPDVSKVFVLSENQI